MCHAHYVAVGRKAVGRGRAKDAKDEEIAAKDLDTASTTAVTPPAVHTTSAPKPTLEPTTEPEKPAKAKRAWPKCSIEGCEKGIYGPSKEARLCYRHHREAGGAPSPFSKEGRAARAAKAGEPAADATPASTVALRLDLLAGASSDHAREETSAGPVAPTTEPVAPAKKTWPTCSTPGCEAKVFMPSGPARLCYRHHIEAGGKPSSIVKPRTAPVEAATIEAPATSSVDAPVSDPAPSPVATSTTPKTKLRKRGAVDPRVSAAPSPASSPPVLDLQAEGSTRQQVREVFLADLAKTRRRR
jgi:hypothetical protein